jgi:hypothetical protein
MNPINYSDRLNHLNNLAAEANTSIKTSKANLNSTYQKTILWLAQSGAINVPEWAKDHIIITEKLKEAVHNLEGYTEIPKEIKKTLKKSQKIERTLAQTIPPEKFLELVQPKGSFIEKNNLLIGQEGISQSTKEWHVNLGLIVKAYKNTSDPELRKKLSFMALQYLAKAAPNMEGGSLMGAQISPAMQHTYHRESDYQFISFKQARTFLASDLVYSFNVVDTSDLQQLYPLFFYMIGNSSTCSLEAQAENWALDLKEILKTHLASIISNDFENPLPKLLLIDLSPFIGDDLVQRDDDQNQRFMQRMREIEEVIENSIEQALSQIPTKNKEEYDRLKVFVKAQLVCFCTKKIQDLDLLITLPTFEDDSHYQTSLPVFKTTKPNIILSNRYDFIAGGLRALKSLGGIRLGGVASRDRIFSVTNLESLLELWGLKRVEYAASGPNVVYFKSKEDILRSNVFVQTREKILGSQQPGLLNLGKATFNLLGGFFEEITEEQWDQINENPTTREVVQNTLYRLMTHLAKVNSTLDNFSEFTETMSLIHSELASLLILFSPFKKGEFETTYLHNLKKVIPRELLPHVKVGIGKSAMNVFAGINGIIHQTTSNPQVAHSSGAYFEEVHLVGPKRTVRDVMKDPLITKIDLYFGEFSPNISIDRRLKRYQGTDVIQEITDLIASKPQTEYLTVAIDCTIDLVQSQKVKKLLKHFAKEIEAGKLNFVFFRSGQKFDMLGMDSYYGAPFYIVNNGSSRWKAFNDLTTRDTYKTDPTSLQWFALANKYAAKQMDGYRKLIFQNCRKVLNQVPVQLQPTNNSKVWVCEVDQTMDPAFIDIKVVGENPGAFRPYLTNELLSTFKKHGMEMYTRASFGFFHCNLNVMPTSDGIGLTFRINMGLDPKEVDLVVEVLQKIAKKYSPTSAAG